jgi:hypothetical protein
MPSADFDAAAAKAKALTKASNDDLLALYKYFKQVRYRSFRFEAPTRCTYRQFQLLSIVLLPLPHPLPRLLSAT